MDVLPLHFRTLQFFGLWYEKKQHWLVKYIWQLFIINIIAFFAILQLAALLVYRDNVNDFIDCLFLSITYFGLCFKLFNFLTRHEEMIQLLGEFRMKICQPMNDREKDVLGKYKKFIAIMFNLYFTAVQLNGVIVAITPLLSMAAGNEAIFLPFKTYEIGNKENSVYYWVTYVFQVAADVICISVHIALDMMLPGFLLLTCGQIDLCCHRFIWSCDNDIRQSSRQCIIHQLSIWRIVRNLESFFMCVVLPLMCLSLITICTSIYNVARADISATESFVFFVYLVSLMCEIYYYSWFGNELKLKSTAICDTVYNSDWTALKPLDRKNLWFIMLSSQREMSISFHGICTLKIEIFVWVLKTSYTAYNLLKTIGH